MRGVRRHRLRKHEDARGWLLRAVDPEHVRGAPFGQIYVVSFEPGARRADHYHEHTTEWFVPLAGRLRVWLGDVDGGAREELTLDVAEPEGLEVGPRVAHAFEALGDEPALLLTFADRNWTPDDPDTVATTLPRAGVEGQRP